MIQKTVWVNGVFDIVHIAHIRLFKYANSLGNILIVGIDGDKRVTAMKGNGRPINPSGIRAEFLERIKGVSLVVEFNTDEELCKWVQELEVDIMVVGEEYKDKKVIGSEFVKEVVFFEKINGFSSTSLIEGNNY